MRLRQVSFDGGELAPELQRRTDLAKYPTSLAQCRNAYAKATGSIVNRTGSRYIATTKDSAAKRSIHVPFKFSNSQAYVLEFGEGYVRFIKDGAQIVYPNTIASVLFATQANPCKVSSGPQHVQNGDLIHISGVVGMTQLNGNDYTVNNSASLALDVIAITKANPAVVTVKTHTGLVNGDRVWLAGVRGMTQVNDIGFTVAGLVTKQTNITGVTRGNTNTVLAVPGHTFVAGETVWISGVKGCYELANRAVLIASVVAGVSITFALDSINFTDYVSGGNVRCHSFQLSGVNSTAYSTYTLQGTATRSTFELLGINSIAFGAYASGGTYQYAPSKLGQPVEVALPYVESDLPYIGFTQSADTLTLLRHGYARRDLVRYDHHLWRVSTPKYGPRVNPPTTVTVSSATSGPRDFYYAVTAVDKDTGEESLARANFVLNEDTANANPIITWTAVPNAAKYNIYKKTGKSATAGAYGFIATTEELTFQDITDASGSADRFTPGALTPPIYQSPDDSLGNPAAATYYKQRLVLANFERGPQNIKLSQIGRFANFGTSSPVRDDDAISSLVASLESQEILYLIGDTDLIILTEGGEWIARGNADGLVSPGSFNGTQHGNNGCARVRPLLVGGSVIYVQSRGKALRDFLFKVETNKYSGDDLSVFAPHFFKNATIVSMAYAQVPDSLIYAVLSDGSLVTLTYLRSEKIWAWAQHTTQGIYEWVTTIPESGEDVTYVTVLRTLNGVAVRSIERFASRRIVDVEDSFFVDCGLTYDGVPVSTVTAAHLANMSCAVLADGVNVGPLVANGAGQIALPAAASVVHVGLGFTSRLQTLEPDVSKLALSNAGLLLNVSGVRLFVSDSHGGYAGPVRAGATMYPVEWAPSYEFPEIRKTGEYSIDIDPDWAHGAVVIEQRDPLPLELLAVETTVEASNV